jgi:hypothetical protein
MSRQSKGAEDTVFGKAAIAAAEALQANWDDLELLWRASVARYSGSYSMVAKGCPKGAFFGLGAAGLLKGVHGQRFPAVNANGTYAIKAVAELLCNPTLSEDRLGLWRRVTPPGLNHNHQMDVVVALFHERILCADRRA